MSCIIVTFNLFDTNNHGVQWLSSLVMDHCFPEWCLIGTGSMALINQSKCLWKLRIEAFQSRGLPQGKLGETGLGQRLVRISVRRGPKPGSVSGVLQTPFLDFLKFLCGWELLEVPDFLLCYLNLCVWILCQFSSKYKGIHLICVLKSLRKVLFRWRNPLIDLLFFALLSKIVSIVGG